MDAMKETWPVVSFLLLHTAIVGFYAGKISNGLAELRSRIERMDHQIETGGLPHCIAHGGRLDSLDKRVSKLEERIK
jgi:hypothetical protein